MKWGILLAAWIIPKFNLVKYVWSVALGSGGTLIEGGFLLFGLLYVHTRSDQSVKDALVAHKVSLRIFLFALVAQVAHDVQFNYADAFKGAVCV